MKQFSKYCIALLFFAFTVSTYAQQIYKEQIDVKGVKMEQKGDSLQVDMEIDLAALKLSHNRYLTLTPILEGSSERKELGDILINGSTRSKVYNRSMALDKSQLLLDNQPHIMAKSKNKDKLSYSQTIPYEAWMKDAHLNMKQVLCGCAGHDEEVAETRLIGEPILALPLTYDAKPQYTFIQPEIEAVKSRGDQFELYLNFPVNKTNILPNYMDNASELAQLKGALDKLKLDKHLDIQKINIVGYASPEGSVANNENLSKGRAEALKKYLVSKLDYPASTYSVKYGGENWSGLTEAVEKSQMSGKDEILSLLNNTNDVNVRKNKLKAYDKGVPYRRMLTDIYPKLRKVILDVQYNVENFSITDAKEIMKTRPELLSPNEMYQIANTYPEGSLEFINAMETAAKVFPKDKSANLNAAVIALSKNDIPLAESYLKKADTSAPEYANTMGILHLQKGDLSQAREEFEKASQKGVTAAKHNLEEVGKKYEIEVLRKQK